MTDYDKFKKKYYIGLVAFCSMLPAVVYGKGQHGDSLFFWLLLSLALLLAGMIWMLPYLGWLTDALNSRKAPFS